MNVIYIADGCNTYEVLQINGGAWYKLWEWNKEFMGVKLGIVGDSYIHEDLHFLHFMIESLDNHQRSKTFLTPIKIIIQVSFSV